MGNPPSSFLSWYRQIGQLVGRYYQEAPRPFNPTRFEYEQWLLTLPDEEHVLSGQLGFTACQAVLAGAA